MKTVKHLDCSLRDGGYYNNWDFKDDLINQYLQVLESINIEYCEIGFRFYKNKGFKGSCAFSTEEFLSSLRIPKNIKIAIMINANEIIENGEVIRGFVGIISNPNYRGDGVMISGVYDGGPGQNAGIRSGDIIKKVNGMKVDKIKDMQDIIGKSKPGDLVSFQIQRIGDILNTNVKVEKMPKL